MTDNKGARLSKLARDFNVGITTIVEFLKKKGFDVEANPNTKVSDDIVVIIQKEYSSDVTVKKESEKLNLKNLRDKKETITLTDVDKKKDNEDEDEEDVDDIDINDIKRNTQHNDLRPEVKVVGKIDLTTVNKTKPQPVQEKVEPIEPKKEVVSKVVPDIEPSEPVKQEMPQAIEPSIVPEHEDLRSKNAIDENIKVIGKINLEEMNLRTRPAKKTAEERDVERRQVEKETRPKHKADAPRKEAIKQSDVAAQEEIVKPTPAAIAVPEIVDENMIKTRFEKLAGPTILGKIDLPIERRPVASSSESASERDKKKKRKRIKIEKERVAVDPASKPNQPVVPRVEKTLEKKGDKKKVKKVFRTEVNEVDVQKQIKDTLARLTTKGKSKTAKYRREKREEIRQRHSDELEQNELDKNILKVTEFVTVAELASMMDVQATQVISTCMSLGLFVSINQRLDAETISIVAEEFNFKVEFVSIDIQEAIEEEADKPEDLSPALLS